MIWKCHFCALKFPLREATFVVEHMNRHLLLKQQGMDDSILETEDKMRSTTP